MVLYSLAAIITAADTRAMPKVPWIDSCPTPCNRGVYQRIIFGKSAICQKLKIKSDMGRSLYSRSSTCLGSGESAFSG